MSEGNEKKIMEAVQRFDFAQSMALAAYNHHCYRKMRTFPILQREIPVFIREIDGWYFRRPKDADR